MDPQTTARLRYDRLKRAMADEKKVRKRARLARALGLGAAGAWVIVPALFWEVDLDSAARAEFFRTPTPHEAYLLALKRQAPSGPVPAVDWEAAAETAIDFPADIGGAYQEAGVFLPSVPQAVGLRVRVPEGQRLRLTVERGGRQGHRMFVDVFRAAPLDPAGASPRQVPRPAFLRGEELDGEGWSFDSDRTSEYVLRLQTTLGDEGTYRIAIQVGAPWRFPVAGAGEADIGSVFGDPRDGGSRNHHGVDIFAERGTPVLAAADGYVSSVDTTEVGGRVVWQREAEGRHSIYYAHLERPLVEEGQRLRAGDTVGLVGNTGNARTTPPHLHFGAYSRGPRDPWNLILPTPPAVPEVAAGLEALGREGRVRGEGVSLRGSPSPRGLLLAALPDGAPFLVLGASEAWYRVLLSDGVSGFINARYSEAVGPEGNTATASTVGEG